MNNTNLNITDIRTFAEWFHVDAERGLVRRKESCNRFQFGDNVGSMNNGSMALRFKAGKISRAKFVWALQYGYIPRRLKHLDGNPLNDAISNLALAVSPYGTNISKQGDGFCVYVLEHRATGFATVTEAVAYRDGYRAASGLPHADADADPLELEAIRQLYAEAVFGDILAAHGLAA